MLLGGPVSGGAGNPARALGPEIVSGTYTAVALYIIGPLLGGVVAAVLYARVVGAASAPQTPIADQPTKDAQRGANGRSGGAGGEQTATRGETVRIGGGRGDSSGATGRPTFTARDEG